MLEFRTITALEYEVIPIIKDVDSAVTSQNTGVWIRDDEADALLRLNDIRPGFCQRLPGGVKLAQYCGIVRLSNCVVEILPKIGISESSSPSELNRSRSALLTMLQSARQLTISQIGPAPQKAVHAPLLDIFIEAFLHCALEQARIGLLSRYMVNEDDLPVIKGKFKAHAHIRHNLARPHMLNCEYDELTVDNVYNRAIRATLEVCRPWIRHSKTQRLWLEIHSRYMCVALTKMSASSVTSLPRDRTTHRYDAVLKWCECLLSMSSPALSSGTMLAPGLLFDMNKLFEAHVARLEVTARRTHVDRTTLSW